MNRDRFIGYLASRSEALDIPLHRGGELKGLPREFHQALAVAQLLVALGHPAPSGELLRAWYGKSAWANAEAARWVYRVAGTLSGPDLEELDVAELLSFWVRFDNWGAAAKLLARRVQQKIQTAL